MHITRPPLIDTPDTPRYLDRLAEQKSFFNPEREIIVARAPGRLDVMGGIADYSGSLVLQLPVAEATFAAVQAQPARVVSVATVDGRGRTRRYESSIGAFGTSASIDYAAARDHFRADPESSWAAYVVGVLLVLMREKKADTPQGVRILIISDVPEGKGVSSSAAIEVATMSALAALLGVELSPEELGVLCQKAENLVVGAPCGVMDQMTSACGQQDRLLALACQPATILGHVAVPPGLAVWGIDSGIRHSVNGADYGAVRTAAFMGYRILADEAGLRVKSIGDGRVRIEDTRWGGYLANVTPSEFDGEFARALPESMSGEAFLARYAGITDTVTHVDAARSYPVRSATAHPIGEHHRIRAFTCLLEYFIDAPSGEREEALQLLGEQMCQSHASYSACGLGSEPTDRLVALVRGKGRAHRLYGAKITGGGSGGTVAILGRSSAEDAVRDIVAHYARETGRSTYLFTGSSPGAAAWGTARLVF